MNLRGVLSNWELFAGSPEAVPRLRELILQLAVQGKLVQQDPKDEPASELLKKIKAEKDKLIARGEMKRDKPSPSTTEVEIPMDLPVGWSSVSLSELGDFRSGKTPNTGTPRYWGGSIPWISSKDMKSPVIVDSEDHVTQAALDDGLAIVPKRSILIVVRSGILRRTLPVAITAVEVTVNQDLKALVLVQKDLAEYLHLLLRGWEQFILANLTKVGTTVESVRFDDFATFPFPLPPLAEQSRIVTRVQELMQLCDALEAKVKLEAQQHETLLRTLLATLTQSTSAEDLAQNWQRLSEHFPLLLDRPQAIDQLEQTILQLAVRGLLVPQNPTDEPASQLLKKIRTEKDKLIQDGKIKRDKPLPPIAEDEQPFELPKGWEWTRVADVCSLVTDGEHLTPARCDDSTQVPLVTAKNVRHEVMDYRVTDFVMREIAEKCWQRCKPLLGDVLMVSVGATLGRLCVLREYREMVLVRSVTILRPVTSGMSVDFFALHLMSQDSQNEIWGEVKQSAQPCLYLAKSAVLKIALPPLPEQHRIVTRVTELRQLCAALRDRLAQSSQIQAQLAKALVLQAG